MDVVLSSLAFMIAILLASEVDSRVCYSGQEPSPDSDYLQWHTAEKNPADCKEFRPGGLNTRPLCRPCDKLPIGGDYDRPDLVRSTTEQAQTSNNESTVTVGISVGLCDTITTVPLSSKPYPETGKFASRLERLEFTVSTPERVRLFLNGDDGNSVYDIQLRPDSSIFQNSRQTGFHPVYPSGPAIGLPGRFWLTYNSGKIQVGKDKGNATLHFNDVDTSIAILSVEFFSSQTTEWQIHMPC